MSKTMTFLRTGDRSDQKPIVAFGKIYWEPRARVECADGFSVSVQAGELTYCTPRSDIGPWTHAEVGFPSERPEPWDLWTEYVEDEDDPTGTVYGYVPIELIEQLIQMHGGES